MCALTGHWWAHEKAREWSESTEGERELGESTDGAREWGESTGGAREWVESTGWAREGPLGSLPRRRGARELSGTLSS